jgi:hypothetical protein
LLSHSSVKYHVADGGLQYPLPLSIACRVRALIATRLVDSRKLRDEAKPGETESAGNHRKIERTESAEIAERAATAPSPQNVSR